jgi:hypothetical protein
LKPESGRTTPFIFDDADIRPSMKAILARIKARAGAPLSLDGSGGTAEAAVEMLYAREKDLIRPRAVFNIQTLTADEKSGETVVTGRDTRFASPLLLRKITGATTGAFFVATIGSGLEERSRTLGAEGRLTESFILDGIASEAVERAVDLLQEFIGRTLGAPAGRLSPGYPGWDLAEQEKVFAVMGKEEIARKTGVSLTSSCYMLPEKSVSGLIFIQGQALPF